MKPVNEIWADYKKPTPPKYRKIGDFALLLIPTIEASLAAAPSDVITETQRFYIGFICSLILVGIKFFTNTYTYSEEKINADL